MQALFKFLFSTRLTGILLFVFAFAIGAATLIENSYDTVTAKVLVYNARWFELVVLLLVVNFIGNIGKYRLFRKEKIYSLLFHLAFIVVIIGAGVTRYTGFEGIMPIKEGETSNVMYSAESYLQIYVRNQDKQYSYDKLLYLNTVTDNSFSVPVEFPGKDKIEVSYKRFIKNAVVELEEGVEGGVDILEIMMGGRQKLQIKNGEIRDYEGLTFAYNNNTRTDAIQFIGNGDNIQVYSPYDILSRNMAALSVEDRSKNTSELGFDTLKRDTVHQIGLRYLLFTQGNQIMVSKVYKDAESIIRQAEEEKKGKDVLVINLNYQGEDVEIPLFGGQGYSPEYVRHQQGDLLFRLGYGARQIEIPFSIRLDDFVLEKYPGGMSPSSFLSEVTLIDERNGIEEPHTIFMNNVMDHDGYRFFQSSYEPDESGTILSVNNDFWGTWITYFGYILLGLGFVLSMLNPKGRFRELLKKVIKMHKKDMGKVVTVSLLFFSSFAYSQVNVVSLEAADKFGRVLVQSNNRFQPSHSLAYDVFHKVSKKDKFEFEEVGKVDAMQLYLDIPLNPLYWAQQDLIYIRGNTGIRELLGIEGAYASINDFMADSIAWIMKPEIVEKIKQSSAKRPIEQNGYDKELLKVNERLNILLMTFYGQMYTIVPIEGSPDNTWVSAVDSLAYVTSIKNLDDGIQLSYALQFQAYMIYLDSAKTNGKDSIPNKILKNLIEQQRAWDKDGLLPSEGMVELEIYYNKTNIFKTLERAYSMLALILLALTIVQVLKEDKNKILNTIIWVLVAVVAVCFAYHSYGLGLRWYLTGHAPWSNGYEALVFISWGSLLIGFIFMKYTKLILAATVLIAFLILMTAGHSSFDPQLTSLQPVLKSYWLIIHVACITLSYSFFGVGFILGIISLFFYLVKNRSNEKRLTRSITLLTYINEMVIIIGIVLATVGTFLGGVWANESWGRYWGWDAKETWALVIVLVYAIVLHLRFMPGKAKGKLTFNLAAIFSFSTVLMTFIGVNYYLSKGLHSYARGTTPAFPVWVWVIIFVLITLSALAVIKEGKNKAIKS